MKYWWEEVQVVLDDLYKIVSAIMNDTNDVDEILQKDKIRDFQSSAKLEKTDQEIDEFIKKNEIDEEKQKILFNVFQKIKIEQSIEIIQGDVEAEIIDNDKKMVYSLFSKILEPDEVEIQDNILRIKYDFSEDSMIKSRISDIKKWGDDNVVETLSNVNYHYNWHIKKVWGKVSLSEETCL